MSSIFDPLLDIMDSWNERSERALARLFGARCLKHAEKDVAPRAPELRGSDSAVHCAAGLTAVPMSAAPERVASPLTDQLRSIH